jgi:hypothetical protein
MFLSHSQRIFISYIVLFSIVAGTNLPNSEGCGPYETECTELCCDGPTCIKDFQALIASGERDACGRWFDSPGDGQGCGTYATVCGNVCCNPVLGRNQTSGTCLHEITALIESGELDNCGRKLTKSGTVETSGPTETAVVNGTKMAATSLGLDMIVAGLVALVIALL